MKLTEQLNGVFKRPFHWNEYKTKKKESRDLDDNNLTRF